MFTKRTSGAITSAQIATISAGIAVNIAEAIAIIAETIITAAIAAYIFIYFPNRSTQEQIPYWCRCYLATCANLDSVA